MSRVNKRRGEGRICKCCEQFTTARLRLMNPNQDKTAVYTKWYQNKTARGKSKPTWPCTCSCVDENSWIVYIEDTRSESALKWLDPNSKVWPINSTWPATVWSFKHMHGCQQNKYGTRQILKRLWRRMIEHLGVNSVSLGVNIWTMYSMYEDRPAHTLMRMVAGSWNLALLGNLAPRSICTGHSSQYPSLSLHHKSYRLKISLKATLYIPCTLYSESAFCLHGCYIAVIGQLWICQSGPRICTKALHSIHSENSREAKLWGVEYVMMKDQDHRKIRMSTRTQNLSEL